MTNLKKLDAHSCRIDQQGIKGLNLIEFDASHNKKIKIELDAEHNEKIKDPMGLAKTFHL